MNRVCQDPGRDTVNKKIDHYSKEFQCHQDIDLSRNMVHHILWPPSTSMGQVLREKFPKILSDRINSGWVSEGRYIRNSPFLYKILRIQHLLLHLELQVQSNKKRQNLSFIL
jgi:hypothetical protein